MRASTVGTPLFPKSLIFQHYIGFIGSQKRQRIEETAQGGYIFGCFTFGCYILDVSTSGCFTFGIFHLRHVPPSGCFTFGGYTFGCFTFGMFHLRDVSPSGCFTFGMFHLRTLHLWMFRLQRLHICFGIHTKLIKHLNPDSGRGQLFLSFIFIKFSKKSKIIKITYNTYNIGFFGELFNIQQLSKILERNRDSECDYRSQTSCLRRIWT